MLLKALAIAFCVIAAPVLYGDEDLDFAGHHGVVHVEDGAEGHHHGDEDDHHDSPASPCHHHETQACTGHANELAPAVAAAFVDPGLALTVKIVTVEPNSLLLVRPIFHIPIA